MILLPKFLGILVFDQANQGAQEATRSCRTPGSSNSSAPRRRTASPARSRSSPTPPTQGAKAIMISNNAGDQIAPAAEAARNAGLERRHLGLADPVRRGRAGLHRPGGLQRDRHRHGRHGPRHPRRRRRQVRRPLRLPRCGQPERLDRRHEGGAQGSEVRQARTGRRRLRQRPVRGQLQPGAGPGRQVPRHEADHGPHHRRHRRGRQGHAGREALRQGQGLRPGPALRDGRPTPRTAAPPSSRSGASSTSATSPTT